jgi:hypothetical protein
MKNRVDILVVTLKFLRSALPLDRVGSDPDHKSTERWFLVRN